MSDNPHWKIPENFNTCKFHKTIQMDGKFYDIYTGFGMYGALFIVVYGPNVGDVIGIYGQFLLRHNEDSGIFEHFKQQGLECTFAYLIDFAKEYYKNILNP
jgi:hypothetical protein